MTNGEIVYAIVENQNSRGSLDLKKLSDYVFQQKNPEAARMDLIVRPRLSEKFIEFLRFAESQGYKLILTTKNNVDTIVLNLIDDAMDRKKPPTKVILGSGDRDYINKIKYITRKYQVKVAIAVGEQRFSTLYKKLGFVEFLSFPRTRYKQEYGQNFCPQCGDTYWGSEQVICPQCGYEE